MQRQRRADASVVSVKLGEFKLSKIKRKFGTLLALLVMAMRTSIFKIFRNAGLALVLTLMGTQASLAQSSRDAVLSQAVGGLFGGKTTDSSSSPQDTGIFFILDLSPSMLEAIQPPNAQSKLDFALFQIKRTLHQFVRDGRKENIGLILSQGTTPGILRNLGPLEEMGEVDRLLRSVVPSHGAPLVSSLKLADRLLSDSSVKHKHVIVFSGDHPDSALYILETDLVSMAESSDLSLRVFVFPSGRQSTVHWQGLAESANDYIDGEITVIDPILPRGFHDYKFNGILDYIGQKN